MNEDHRRLRVESLLAELKERRLPWPKEKIPEVDDVVSDLAPDEAYVAGLATTYLKTRSPGVREIRIDVSMPRRIDRLRERIPQEDEDAIRSYLQLMDDLARAISDASGTPLVEWDREGEARARSS
jgi:hypothetical protein